ESRSFFLGSSIHHYLNVAALTTTKETPMNLMNRWSFLVASCALVLGLNAHAQQPTPIRVGVQSIPPDAVFMAKDWLGPHGLKADISEFSSGGDMMQAFIAGKLDIADGGSGRLVTLAATQPDFFYI